MGQVSPAVLSLPSTLAIVVGVVLLQVCWIDALAVLFESPTTGAGLSNIYGADGTAMTFFGLSFTVTSRSPGWRAEPVIVRTVGCGVGQSSFRAVALR